MQLNKRIKEKEAGKRLAVSMLLLAAIFLFALAPQLSQYLDPEPARAASCSYTVTNTSNSGAGSLREAITSANSAPGTPTVCFAIPGGGVHTIAPTSPLPAISGSMVIDGSTQTGFAGAPLIELNGTSAGGQPGLVLAAGDSTVRGLIINRFAANGILISGGSGNIIAGNYIGTNASGTAAAGNGSDGIGIYNTPGNTIGGATPADRNLVSGNIGNGICLYLSGAANNIIAGNYIGTNASGTSSIPNTADGILVNEAPNNTIGGTTGNTPGGACTGACNLVSGNGYNGVGIWHTGASGNQILGNYVGVDASGSFAVPNAVIGVEVQDAAGAVVGGTNDSARNIISGNAGAGILLTGPEAHDNTVAGNFIGTNAAGNGGVGNVKNGIVIGYSPGIYSAHNNTIGGTTGTTPGGACTGACNLVSGNIENGIFITNNSYGGGNIVAGNYVGTDAAGVGGIGNHLDGIGILDVPNNQIGGPTAAERNVIGANGDNGIIVVGAASTGNRVEGNYIGRSSPGGILGNVGFGVEIASGSDTAIVGNGIYANSKNGIDLNYDNVTPNDPGDGDGGPNRLQNFPVIVSANTAGGATTVAGYLSSTPNTWFHIEFFSCQYCNAGPPNDYGEGQVYLGYVNVPTDGSGYAGFGPPVGPVQGGQFVTATATKIIGATPAETSEFSQCRQVTGNVDVTPPSVSIPAPTGSSYVSGTVNFSANAADNVGISRVDLYIDDVLVVQDSSWPYSYQWDTTGYSAGDHALKAVAVDTSGLTGEATTSITVDNFAPLRSYYFTWYDQSYGDWKDWVLMANPASGSATARSSLSIGPLTYIDTMLGVGAPAQTPSFPGMMGGPVVVDSSQPMIVSQRVLYKDSFNEITAVPESQLEHDYFFTWYDLASPTMRGNWILISNQETDPAQVEVYIGGTLMGSYSVAGGGRITPSYPGVMGGPVRVTCTGCAAGHKLMVSQRVLYKDSFNEVAGVPASGLTSDYSFTWYDCKAGNFMGGNWILVSNQDTGSADVEIYIGDALVGRYGIPEGGIITPQYPEYMGGPVRVVSTNGKKLLVSQRIIFKDSFEEVQGLTDANEGTDLWFTWYDSLPGNFMNGNWVLVANQGASNADVDVYIGGSLRTQVTLAPGENRPLVFPNTMAGPLRVISTNGQPLLATQRVLYKNSFNEVAGIAVD